MPKLNFTLSSLLHYVAVSICFFILSNQVIYGQNLVPNPGFEEYEVCPTMLGDGGPLEAIPWYSTITGTCDYFNACNNPGPIGVPFNFQGAQLAHGGVAYAGISSNARKFLPGVFASAVTGHARSRCLLQDRHVRQRH